jgi:hypothetical protein
MRCVLFVDYTFISVSVWRMADTRWGTVGTLPNRSENITAIIARLRSLFVLYLVPSTPTVAGDYGI